MSNAAAWAAGFFDGEGCTTTRIFQTKRSANPQRSITMQINQKGREPLDRFRDAVMCGRVLGPYTNGQTDARDIFRWQATTKAEVHQAIWLLWFWLSNPKRRQIEQACEKYHGGSWDERRGRRFIPHEDE